MRTMGLQSADDSALEISACLGVKDIGKPCALIAHARFDEGGQAYQAMAGLFRHRQTKGAETDKLNLMSYAPVLYSTRFIGGKLRHR